MNQELENELQLYDGEFDTLKVNQKFALISKGIQKRAIVLVSLCAELVKYFEEHDRFDDDMLCALPDFIDEIYQSSSQLIKPKKKLHLTHNELEIFKTYLQTHNKSIQSDSNNYDMTVELFEEVDPTYLDIPNSHGFEKSKQEQMLISKLTTGIVAIHHSKL